MSRRFPRRPINLSRFLIWTLILIVVLPTTLSVIPGQEAAAAPNPQTSIENQDVVDALSTWFGTYGSHEFTQRGWVVIGDLAKIRARLETWDVETYIDPDHLSSSDSAAQYVDFWERGWGFYFNDLVFADQPANIPGKTLWHETMHAIFDAHDDDESFLVENDEIYTWYMEGQVTALRYLIRYEEELKSEDCDPEELEKRWGYYVNFLNSKAVDYGGYGKITAAGKKQVAQLTGFWVPDPVTLQGLYQSSGLIDKCGEEETQPAQPTTSSSGGKMKASRMFLIDNSFSMRGEFIANAISSAQTTLGGLSPSTEVAVMFFGTAGCQVSVVQDFTLDHAAASQVIGTAQARGDTPLAAAITRAGQYMRSSASTGDRVMTLLTDGQETCGGDPVEAARQLNNSSSQLEGHPYSLAAGIKLLLHPGLKEQSSGTITLHIIGFNIPAESFAEQQLQEVAAAGLGNYYPAGDEAELTEAMQQAVEENPAVGRVLPKWAFLMGASLLCFTSLAAVGGAAAVFLYRRRVSKAEPAGEEPSPEDAKADQKTSKACLVRSCLIAVVIGAVIIGCLGTVTFVLGVTGADLPDLDLLDRSGSDSESISPFSSEDDPEEPFTVVITTPMPVPPPRPAPQVNAIVMERYSPSQSSMSFTYPAAWKSTYTDELGVNFEDPDSGTLLIAGEGSVDQGTTASEAADALLLDVEVLAREEEIQIIESIPWQTPTGDDAHLTLTEFTDVEGVHKWLFSLQIVEGEKEYYLMLFGEDPGEAAVYAELIERLAASFKR
ncbi:MAG: VWA domain-containing protein [Anaerolineales bacterium]